MASMRVPGHLAQAPRRRRRIWRRPAAGACAVWRCVCRAGWSGAPAPRPAPRRQLRELRSSPAALFPLSMVHFIAQGRALQVAWWYAYPIMQLHVGGNKAMMSAQQCPADADAKGFM